MMKLKNTIVIKKMCVLYYGCKRMGGGDKVGGMRYVLLFFKGNDKWI